jgi:hypothetical protein
VLSIIESLVTEKNDQNDSETMESSQDSEVLTPIDLLDQEAGDEWS